MPAEDILSPGLGDKRVVKDMGFNSAPGVLIAVPMCGRPLSNKWGLLFSVQDAGTNQQKMIMHTEGVEVGIARQTMAEVSISRAHDGRKNCTFCGRPMDELKDEPVCPSRQPFGYIWFVDDDVLLPPQALRELLDKLTKIRATEEIKCGEAKTVAIGGIYCTKEELTTPVAYRKLGNGPSWNWIRGLIFEVEGIGTGCLLIHTSAFEKLPRPWFKTVDADERDEEGSMMHVGVTDDLYFCRKVKAAGLKIAAHGGIICGHYDYKTQKIFTIPKDSPPMVMAREIEKDPGLLDKYLDNIAALEERAPQTDAALAAEAAKASYNAVPPTVGNPPAA